MTDLATAGRLRQVLLTAGFEAATIATSLGTNIRRLVVTDDVPVYDRRLRSSAPLEALIRMFLLELPVAEADASAVLSADLLSALAASGLVRTQDGQVTGAVQVVPHGPLFVVSDPISASPTRDLVVGAQRPSLTLADLTVRRTGERTLDLGTGSGLQAFLATQHSAHVVATDINERAITMAQWGAALNALPNVEFRYGDLFEPIVEGEQFDLVVANPPYVISPEHRFTFRDSGFTADQLSEHVVRTVPGLMNEDGFASIMISWVAGVDGELPRPLTWLEGSGCDALLLIGAEHEPLVAARMWNENLKSDPALFTAAIDDWLEYYRSHDIGRIGYGTVVLCRRTAAENWLTALALPDRITPASAHLARMFAAGDVLHDLGEDHRPLLERTLAIVPDASLVRRHRLEVSGWATVDTELRMDRGIGYEVGLDDRAAALVAGLDGSRTLAAVIDGVTVGDDDDADRDAALALVTTLLRLGFLDGASASTVTTV